MARTLWAGPGVSLRGEGEVEIAFDGGGYLRLGEDYVHVASPRAPRGPLTLLVAGLDPLRPGEPAWVGDTLHIGPRELPLVERSRAPALGPLRPGWRAALVAALEAIPGPPLELLDGIAALRKGDVTALAGRGEGLTPAGDDVLAGYAAWRREAISARVADRCSPIGLAYLRCAERGELPEPVARAVAAIRAGDAEAARRRARALSRWGSSSGAAMLWGVACAP
jgi:Protein of unknown function (DUF2877)